MERIKEWRATIAAVVTGALAVLAEITGILDQISAALGGGG